MALERWMPPKLPRRTRSPPGEGNRRASRNGRVSAISHPTPTRFATFRIAVRLSVPALAAAACPNSGAPVAARETCLPHSLSLSHSHSLSRVISLSLSLSLPPALVRTLGGLQERRVPRRQRHGGRPRGVGHAEGVLEVQRCPVRRQQRHGVARTVHALRTGQRVQPGLRLMAR
jgi:hypothetical protein